MGLQLADPGLKPARLLGSTEEWGSARAMVESLPRDLEARAWESPTLPCFVSLLLPLLIALLLNLHLIC